MLRIFLQLFIGALLWYAGPSFAGKVIMTGTDCAVVSNGPDYTITCGTKVETPPVTPPTTPPVTPPVATLCPVVPVVNENLPANGQARQIFAPTGEIHTWAMPTKATGTFTSSDYPGTPSVVIEWAISPCKGDFTYYKTDAAKVIVRGVPMVVCGQQSGATGGVSWGTSSTCQVKPGWFVNYRIVSGCPPGTACPINYLWN